MKIALVLKPYAIEVYSSENGAYALMGTEHTTRIHDESSKDYEQRMVFVCKTLCTDMRQSDFFRKIAPKLESIDIILCAPWCVYDVLQVEKDLGKPTRIDKKLIEDMRVKKAENDAFVVESFTSNMQLNGYSVPAIAGQVAQTVEFQYVHIYASKPFIDSLTKAIEGIFHTHKINLLTMYGLAERLAAAEEKRPEYEFRIILEEESLDVVYSAKGLHVINTFVPYSYRHLEAVIGLKLAVKPEMIGSILESRHEALHGNAVQKPNLKHAKKLWPDLDEKTKSLIDQAVAESVEQVLKSIRDSVDSIPPEFTKESVSVTVYCLNRKLITLYGDELAKKLQSDEYVRLKLNIQEEPITVRSIF